MRAIIEPLFSLILHFFSPVTNSVANIHKHWAHFIDSTKIYCEPHVQFCFHHLTNLIAVLRSSVIMSVWCVCKWMFMGFLFCTSLRAQGSVHASTVGWSSPLDMPEDDLGDRIHCCCRSSFWDNVIMGRDRWQLCFLSAQIFYNVNNECHSLAMSTMAKQVHEYIPMCPLILSPLCTFPPLIHFTFPN